MEVMCKTNSPSVLEKISPQKQKSISHHVFHTGLPCSFVSGSWIRISSLVQDFLQLDISLITPLKHQCSEVLLYSQSSPPSPLGSFFDIGALHTNGQLGNYQTCLETSQGICHSKGCKPWPGFSHCHRGVNKAVTGSVGESNPGFATAAAAGTGKK